MGIFLFLYFYYIISKEAKNFEHLSFSQIRCPKIQLYGIWSNLLFNYLKIVPCHEKRTKSFLDLGSFSFLSNLLFHNKTACEDVVGIRLTVVNGSCKKYCCFHSICPFFLLCLSKVRSVEYYV